ncbi:MULTISPECIES: 5-amino-6-(5-phospho-D-ribitylamino)uracil phosphatase YigB [Dickeya]|uniref:FMN hydrolase 5-Amino-6-(5'-phosphoribitylamino)uracil phosphatase n=1 Tax=Dickeya aquatica TaxID=1401087 RepID=A0A375AFX8_9GAMM|nr:MULTISPECIES: 5-amino-6-(5-phospho-D-ribitylamino)uracil phosphatase YigB [Dickeya]SLM64963.1 Putative FMN hydrolase; 5-Amino-6-(5'-phosphoribitylamino)uracil phosphatase [Dickeya aquatica]
MYFYRPLGRIEAITFDLDDTLYDNAEVIRRTEVESLQFLQRYHPGLQAFTSEKLRQLRQQLLAQDPEIYHDVTRWRWQGVQLAMREAGLSAQEAKEGADAAMAEFARWRSRIAVPEQTHETLRLLAQRWPLVAITNGNADPHACGLGEYFRFVLRAGPDGRAKPYHDMYHLAAERLNMPLHSLLHVGDDLTTDVAGSLRCGMQACWINTQGGNLMQIHDSRLLPHVEIFSLASLTTLL